MPHLPRSPSPGGPRAIARASGRSRIKTVAVAAVAIAATLTTVPAAAAGPPKAAFTYTPAAPVVGGRIALTAKGSKCSARPCRYRWTVKPSSGRLGRARTASFVPTAAGAYDVTLRVTDRRRRSAKRNGRISVTARPVAPLTPLPAPVFPAGEPDSPPLSAASPSAPASPSITSPPEDSLQASSTVVPTGAAEPGAEVWVLEAGVIRARTTAGAGGGWSAAIADVADGRHAFSATALNAGGASAPSPARTVTVDTVIATPAITSPDDATWSATGSYALAGTAEPGATVRVAGAGAGNRSAVATDAGTWSLTLSGVGEGEHLYSARATDRAGNTSDSSAGRIVRVDLTAPAAPTVTTPEADAWSSAGAFTVAGTAEPGVRISLLEGTDELALLGEVGADGTWSGTVQGRQEGPHAISVVATDAAGNAASRAVPVINVSAQAPVPALDAAPSGVIADRSAAIAFSSGLGAAFECRLDGPSSEEGAYAACTSPRRFDQLAPGTYTVLVRLRDLAGDVDAAPVSRSFSVSTGVGVSRFVAPYGSDAGECTAALPCATVTRAAALADAGQLVEVEDGHYLDQSLGADAAGVTVAGAQGTLPALRTLDASADDLIVRGVKAERIVVRGSRQLYDRVEVDARFATHVGFEHLQGQGNEFRNGRIGNVLDEKGALVGPGGFTFDRVEFHDVRASNPSVHNECFFASGADGLTIRRSWFHGCATMDLFFTNYADGPDYGDITLENNVFEHSTTEDGDEWHFASVRVGDTGPSARLDNWLVRNNSFEIGAVVTPTNGTGRWVANLGDWDCVDGVAYRFNVGRNCAELDNGVFPPFSTKAQPAPFGWRDPAHHDFGLLPDSFAVDAGDPDDHPPVDRVGTARPQGFAPDAGAHELPQDEPPPD